MKMTLFTKPAVMLATCATLSISAIGQTSTSISTSGGSTSAGAETNGGKTNPLLGGTGTYGSSAQGSTSGGGADSVPSPAIRSINETFRRMDRNGDGTLSIEEFRAAYSIPIGTNGAQGRRHTGRSR